MDSSRNLYLQLPWGAWEECSGDPVSLVDFRTQLALKIPRGYRLYDWEPRRFDEGRIAVWMAVPE